MAAATIEASTVLAVGGRPLTAKGRATRSRIVDAAAQLMLEQGAAHTTLDDIQRDAGVNASQMYHYFADRNDLVLAVIDHQVDAVLGVHRAALDGLDSFEALQVWRDLIVAMVAAQECVGGCPIGSLAHLAEIDLTVRGALQVAFTQWEQLLRAGLARMRGNRLLRPEIDTNELALALLAGVQGGLLLSQIRRDTRALEAALDTGIAHLRTLAPSGALQP